MSNPRFIHYWIHNRLHIRYVCRWTAIITSSRWILCDIWIWDLLHWKLEGILPPLLYYWWFVIWYKGIHCSGFYWLTFWTVYCCMIFVYIYIIIISSECNVVSSVLLFLTWFFWTIILSFLFLPFRSTFSYHFLSHGENYTFERWKSQKVQNRV